MLEILTEILCDKIYNMYIMMINEILSMFKTLLALGKTNPKLQAAVITGKTFTNISRFLKCVALIHGGLPPRIRAGPAGPTPLRSDCVLPPSPRWGLGPETPGSPVC